MESSVVVTKLDADEHNLGASQLPAVMYMACCTP